MSDHLVRVVRIDELRPHPNADKLEIAVVGGWQVVTGKANHQVGDVVVHVPPDSMVLREYADEWGVTPYLSFKANARAGRVKAVRLRGVPSFGFLVPNSNNAAVGTDLREQLEIVKYEAPAKSLAAGQMASEHPLFHRYTNIENLRNYPTALDYSRELICTEKIHGTSSRVGWVRRTQANLLPIEAVGLPMSERERLYNEATFEKVVGSHRTQRKLEEPGVYGLPWKLHEAELRAMFDELCQVDHESMPDFRVDSVIFFGEIYGPGIQDLRYGAEGPEYRIFDIALNGDYMHWDVVDRLCKRHGVPHVPVLHRGIFTFQELCDMAEGQSSLESEQIKEGVVVRPPIEGRWDGGCRRQIFKLISPDYLSRKGGTEDH